MTGDLRIIALALLGGVLGWALGKVLDHYGKGLAPYAVIVVLVIYVLIILTQ